MKMNELNPSKSQCQTVAKIILKQHPKSFADDMRDGTVIGIGYGSLSTQLKAQVEHVNVFKCSLRMKEAEKGLKFTCRHR